MKLARFKLGDLIDLIEIRNENKEYGIYDVKGISIQKEFIETKANMEGVSLKSYYLVEPDNFAYVTVTSRNGEKITIAHNTTDKTYIVSSSYIVFTVKRKDLLNSDFLFMFFNRPEFDRYSRFNSWGSARETFSWEEMCDIDIDLPPLSIQEKYVDIYNSMLKNQYCYESGLDDLKLVCDAYIESLKKDNECVPIRDFIWQKNDRNTNNAIDCVMGLSTKKEFREAQSRVNRNELGNYKIVKKNEFAFVPTTDTWKVLAFAVNKFNKDIVVSPIYEVFKVDSNIIIPDYLAIWLSRKEFDRYARFHSWGSARENFSFEDMCNVSIPIPSKQIQQSIIDIFTVYKKRKHINDVMKSKIKHICPILINGSIKESQREA